MKQLYVPLNRGTTTGLTRNPSYSFTEASDWHHPLAPPLYAPDQNPSLSLAMLLNLDINRTSVNSFLFHFMTSYVGESLKS